MKTLKRATGETLTLVFNPQGALSSAKLEGEDVTREIRYIREDDCARILKLFGFRDDWSESDLKIIQEINKKLNTIGFAVTGALSKSDKSYSIMLSKEGDTGIHPFFLGTAIFSLEEEEFIRLVPLDMSLTLDLLNSAL